MSEERDDKRKKPVGGFEQGLRSTLRKAPGLAAPSWATMQTAMAGGAAGGAAAASWRWIIGPVAGAAMIGGALWFTDPVEPTPDVVELSPTASSDSEVISIEPSANAAAETASAQMLSETASELSLDDMSTLPDASTEAVGSQALDSELDVAEAAPDEMELTPVPKDWASLPAERAAAFETDITAACVGTEIGFRMGQPMKEVRVLWNFGDGQFSSQASPRHVFKAPGTYDITLSVTRISDGLIRTRTIENLVTIHPKPEADITWEVPATAAAIPRIALRNRSRDAASATWVVDGESTRAGESVAFELPRVGEHRIQLVASSPEGCQSVATHDIEVGSRFGLGASARFSPDGDGRYDTFFPRKLMNEDLSFVFRVEDPTGHIVHETVEIQAWDGALPDGRKAQPGERFRWTAVLQGEVGPSYFSDEVVVE